MKRVFERIVLAIASVAAVLSFVPTVEAGFVSATATGPATITGPASTMVNFAGVGPYSGTPFLESLTGAPGAVKLDFAFDATRDGGQYNRLVLVKTNNTGIALGGYSFTFSSVTSSFTTPVGVQVGTYNGATNPPTFTNVSTIAASGSFTYNGLIANGDTVAFYIPLLISTSGAGTFTIDQTSIVPEPSSIALMGLGGIGLAIGAYRRRRASV